MKIPILFAGILLAALPLAAGAADAPGARVGEVRSFVVNATNPDQIAQLHRDGWLEARGQVVPVTAFPELFAVVGRTWTGRRVPSGRFAVPVLGAERRTERNPFGVLGPGDLVTSGEQGRPATAESTWIYAGRDVAVALESAGVSGR